MSLHVFSLGHLTSAEQIDVCAEFDTTRLFPYSSAEGRKCLCANLESEFKMYMCKEVSDIKTSLKSQTLV